MSPLNAHLMTRPPNSRFRGFTLIELLVVITIIVVLLALLTPALDKAVYQAQLAVCGANLHLIGNGTIGYAFDHKRRYPHRSGVHAPELNWLPIYIRSAFQGEHDDRPELSSYLSINKSLNDPLSPGAVDFEETGLTDDATHIYASYALWFDWQYHPGVGGTRGQNISEKPMARLGDRWTWTDPPELGGKRHEFNILATDFDRINLGELKLSSHPDRDGLLAPLVYQDSQQGAVGLAVRQTISFWSGTADNPPRSVTDLNTAFDDGSVRRYTDVKWDEWRKGGPIVQVSEATDGFGYNQFYNQVPER